MRRVILPLISSLVIAASGPAVGDHIVEKPDSIRYVKHEVTRGDGYAFACRGEGFTTVFDALSVTDNKGRVRRGSFGAAAVVGGVRVSVGIFGTEIEHEVLPAGPGGFGLESETRGDVTRSGILRAAWANWGGSFDCEVRINGTTIPS